MMDRRLRSILKELIQAKKALTSKFIANINQVTPRTTQEDIKKLNQQLLSHGASIQSIKGRGYHLSIEDEHLFHDFLTSALYENKDQGQIPNTPEQRVRYIIQKLLVTMDYWKLEDLADEMYISKATIQNDMKLVREHLSKFYLDILVKPNYGIRIIGEEIKIRFCMAEYLIQRGSNSNGDIYDGFIRLPKEQTDFIKQTIIARLDEQHMTLSDIAIQNLFIHITIAVLRIQNGHPVDNDTNPKQEVNRTKEYRVAEKIVEDTEKKLGVIFPPTETSYVALHLLGTKILTSADTGENQDIESLLDPAIYELVTAMLDQIELEMHLNIRHDRELMINLGLHLKPAMNRYKYGMNIRNPMLESIKKNYQLAFQAAVHAGVVIEKYTDISIDENEIAYLALHIGAAMERQKLKQGPKRCLIVCASGMGTSQLIYYRLKSKFDGKIDIAGTTEYYRLSTYPLEDIDFIITTIPIHEELGIPIVEVNAIISKDDLQHISSYIAGNPSNVIRNYLQENYLFLNQSCTAKEDILAFMVNEIESDHWKRIQFLESINEREKIAPTAFGNLVAIPHPLTPQSTQTFISIATLKEPIPWTTEKRVQFVVLLSVKKNSIEDLQPLYEMISKLIERPESLQKLIQTTDKAMFMRMIETIEKL
ncbi:BglG family transcription antiterminator [Oceanobacillus neutriphilus]|uniref:LicABCH operon regulator n=1 Tax=Oceanobacillus neutriphilus TaxID=531815 RepID=A0ABQ2NV56_9BACI|nr:BglG family transcription antiterminator [Oceanobacillus neutriphilus]GGP11301.1 putative licABCH operon regulator [Oceanobacillus neutriphilus]